MFWTCFEVILFRKKSPVHLGGSRLGKNFKKSKNFETFKIVRKCSQKHCLRMFWLSFSTENAVPSAHKRLKKIHENRKISKFQNPEKPFQKCPNLLEVIFSEFFLPSATWRSNFVKIGRKIEKIWFLENVQNFLKSVQTSFKLVLR